MQSLLFLHIFLIGLVSAGCSSSTPRSSDETDGGGGVNSPVTTGGQGAAGTAGDEEVIDPGGGPAGGGPSDGDPEDPNPPDADNVNEPTRPDGNDAFGNEYEADYSNCPDDAPIEDADCGESTLWCTYGDSVRVDCRDKFYCAPSGWRKFPDCITVAPELCPATPPTGSYCDNPMIDDPSQRVCAFDDGTLCTCNSCSETQWCWECIAPPDGADCPKVIPNYGDPCSNQGVSCDYGDPCQGGGRRICREGSWVPLHPNLCGE